jgi:CDP-diacylglycerol--glycerol-3-phosphate 3-phosphatidyltransferase
MISVYNIKPKFQELLKPVLALMYKLAITANQITISSIFLSLIIGTGFWFADKNIALFLILPIGLFLRMALNALDGMMAKIYHQQSKKGEILNEMGDIISDFFVFLPLLKFEQEISYLIVIFICLSMINEFAGVLGKAVSNERRYDGPMGKSDRALILGIYGILSYFSINFNKYSTYIFSVIILLLVLSTIIRIKKSLK